MLDNTAPINDLIRLQQWNMAAQRAVSHPAEIAFRCIGDDDDEGYTALHRAVSSPLCPLDALQLMLSSSGAHKAAVTPCLEGKWTPLHLCCKNIARDELIIAVARANPAAIAMQDEEGDTPLHSACRYGASDLVLQTLIGMTFDSDVHAAFAKADYADGDLPLHSAISHQAPPEVVSMLLDAYPEGIGALNNSNQTPLHLACECERHDIVMIIIESHASLGCVQDLLSVCDRWGHTPLWVLWNRYLEVTTDNDGRSSLTVELLDSITTLVLIAHYGSSRDSSIHWRMLDFASSYRVLLAAINLGEGIVPSPFVLLLLNNNPGLLLKRDKEGRLPLHIAILQHTQPCSSITTISCPNFLYSNFVDDDEGFDNRSKDEENRCVTALDDEEVLFNFDDSVFESAAFPGDIGTSFDDVDEFVHSSQDIDEVILSSMQRRSGCNMPYFSSLETSMIDVTTTAAPMSCVSSSILKILLDADSITASVPDREGRLPLHLAVDAGISWERGLEAVFMAAPDSLGIMAMDENNMGLFPFMFAATTAASSVETIYHLLRRSPELIGIAENRLAQSSPKRKIYEQHLPKTEWQQNKKRRMLKHALLL